MGHREKSIGNATGGTGISGLISYLGECGKSFGRSKLGAVLSPILGLISLISLILPFVNMPHWVILAAPWLKVSPLTALLIVAFCFVVVLGYGGHKLHGETLLALGKATAKLAERKQTVVAAGDWIDLSDRFKRVEIGIRADFFRDPNKSERWSVRCDTNNECESLCRYAGSMLLRSPKLYNAIPLDIRSEMDPLARWFRFLQTTEVGRIKHMDHGIVRSERGEESGFFQSGSIDNLGKVSSVACIQCAEKET